MRIGVVAPRQPPTVGGGFTFHTTVLEALGRTRTDHEFILLDIAGIGASKWTQGSLTLIDLPDMFPSDEPRQSATSITQLAALKLGLDVVWYIDPHAETLSVPVFATVLDLAHRQYPFFPEVSSIGWNWDSRESHYRSVLPRAARIFTGTHIGKEQIIRCYGVNPENVVVNPFPTPTFAQSSESVSDTEILARHSLAPGFLFYPAQFWPHKNHVTLLMALKHLETHHQLTPDLVLTGADKGNMTHVRRLAEELGLLKRVHFLGYIPSTDLAALYRHAAVLTFPSLFGPDNLPPLEAFSFDCPVVASRIKGMEEQLGKNAAGFFDPTSPKEIAKAIARVLCDGDYRTGLIKNGQALANKRTPEAYVQVVLQTFDDFKPWRHNWPSSDTT
jgi:glycosyltransferase involved in cell wall biosynthesis